MELAIYVLLAATSVLSYAAMFAHWQRSYPSLAEEDHVKDWFVAFVGALPVVGPLATLTSTACYRKAGDYKFGASFNAA
jgi:hypothetical protein